MILPMKKVSILMLDSEKDEAMKKVRSLGLIHIDQKKMTGEKYGLLHDEAVALRDAVQLLTEYAGKNKKKGADTQSADLTRDQVLQTAREVLRLSEEKKSDSSEIRRLHTELDRLKFYGNINPEDFAYLSEKGIDLSLVEMSRDDYQNLPDDVKTIFLNQNKSTMRVVVIREKGDEPVALPASARRIDLPESSSEDMRTEITSLEEKNKRIDEEILTYVKYLGALKKAQKLNAKDSEFEAYLEGLDSELLAGEKPKDLSLALLNGYIPAEDLPRLQKAAKAESWGLISEDPTPEDNVPTKLRNNRFASLIYPLTDFLGTVPGYYEYDISGWFLVFMLIFFGIIFGDGGYGLLITGAAVALILKQRSEKKKAAQVDYLLLAFGLATVAWGTITCTWFGIPMDILPGWLKAISLPIFSNAYEDVLWYPFWTNGKAGLTTAQNIQILCFSLALAQLSIAHIIGIIRNRHSLSLLGDLGSLMQLIGMFYVVLTVVVSGAVFGFHRVIFGIPVGKVSIALVGIGFVIYFIFGSYEGSVKDSVLDSLKNIISMLLGVVNVFSDIVSYIRLWAVGLAGAAISQTVNSMAGPMLGHLVLFLLGVVILLFGHGLNIILNVLSVVVHGVRLNTLEFSSHMNISWSGHKYEPFRE